MLDGAEPPTSKVNPLICSASPRDIPEVKEALEKIRCDRVLAKYYTEIEAYAHLREFFLAHKEYSHMVLCPDDLVVTSQAFEAMRRDVEAGLILGGQNRFRVLSAMCNVVWNLPKLTFNMKGDNHIDFCDLEQVVTLARYLDRPILQVKDCYFSCTWIRREVVEKVSFDGLPAEEGCKCFNCMHGVKRHSIDYAFAQECNKRDIMMFVDTRVRLKHLAWRLGIDVFENLGLGVEEPEMRFRKA